MRTLFSAKPVRAGQTSSSKLSTVITPFAVPILAHVRHIVNAQTEHIHTLTIEAYRVASEDPFIMHEWVSRFTANTFIYPSVSDMYPDGGFFTEASSILKDLKRNKTL